jgi:hypothetical protein
MSNYLSGRVSRIQVPKGTIKSTITPLNREPITNKTDVPAATKALNGLF